MFTCETVQATQGTEDTLCENWPFRAPRPRVPRNHSNLIKVWLRFVVLNIPLKIHYCKVCTCFALAASFVAAVTGVEAFALKRLPTIFAPYHSNNAVMEE